MPALYQQLIVQARKLACMDKRRPGQGNLRRSVSTAYYALFHFLIEQSCRQHVGGAQADEGFRTLMWRAFSHGVMYDAAKTFAGGTLPKIVTRSVGSLTVHPDLKALSQLFLDAQDQRHQADYDMTIRFVRAEVEGLIDRIEQAFARWPGIQNQNSSRLFLMALLLWKQVKDRP